MGGGRQPVSAYLGRPVFDFAIDWEKNPIISRNYDLRPLDLAFGPLRFTRLQSSVAHGFEFVLKLMNEQVVVDFETFVDAVKGRLNGFWFPEPITALKIVGLIAGTQYYIVDQNLRNTWSDNPDIYVAFFKSGSTTQFTKILSVTLDGSLEKVVFETPLTPVDATWTCYRLAYVRFASDDEQFDYFFEQAEKRTIKLIELPTEYAAVEIGQQPVYFYRFFFGGPGAAISATNDWFYTGQNSDIASTYNGAIASKSHVASPVSHGAIEDSLTADA